MGELIVFFSNNTKLFYSCVPTKAVIKLFQVSNLDTQEIEMFAREISPRFL